MFWAEDRACVTGLATQFGGYRKHLFLHAQFGPSINQGLVRYDLYLGFKLLVCFEVQVLVARCERQ
jgi:hypothetical protein